jgi:hypothetical protein
LDHLWLIGYDTSITNIEMATIMLLKNAQSVFIEHFQNKLGSKLIIENSSGPDVELLQMQHCT